MMKFDHKLFFSEYREQFGKLTQKQVDYLNLLLQSIETESVLDTMPHDLSVPYLSYMLATAKHETAHDFEPKHEIGRGVGRMYGRPVQLNRKEQRLYYGRGLVQLTWLQNYARASLLCNVDFVSNPDLVCKYPYCWIILRDGMMKGWFTGFSLLHYIDDSRKDYVGARFIINGQDKAVLIAEYAKRFEKIIYASLLISQSV
jgi:putative chitinase